jgi:hypothetical protein
MRSVEETSIYKLWSWTPLAGTVQDRRLLEDRGGGSGMSTPGGTIRDLQEAFPHGAGAANLLTHWLPPSGSD